MNIVITNQSALPIYAQITEQIRRQIQTGELAEGALLPSIRKLAKECGVSVITTTRAYNDLENEGLIASIPGKGSVVLPQDNDKLREKTREQIEAALSDAVEQAKRINMKKKELKRIIDALYEK